MRQPLPTSWLAYRRRNAVAVAGLVFGFPFVVVLAIVCKLWWPNGALAVLVGGALVWSIVWGWCAFRLVRWPCPRCGVSWLANQDPRIGAKRCCTSCHLALYESP